MVFYGFILLAGFVSCSKLVETGVPSTQLTTANVFNDDQSATAVVSAIYAQFNAGIVSNVSSNFGLYTDELNTTSSNASTLEYYNGSVSVNNSTNLTVWRGFYSVIYQCNALLERIDDVPAITSAVRNQLKGECLFLRALSLFYSVNIYGDIPLLLTTDLDVTSVAPRSSITEIYLQIEKDLQEAKMLLPESYVNAEKVRANKWAVAALQSSVYLFQKKWIKAEAAATEVIASGIYDSSIPLNGIFLKNSKETILQFWTQNGFTQTGNLFIPSGSSTPVYILPDGLLNSFETGDQRKTAWLKTVVIGVQSYTYPYKYKNRSTTTGINAEYVMLLRLSEQYLNRAEARAQQDNLTGAKTDLDVIRIRAGLPNSIAITKNALLLLIEQERRVEFFGEWGQRYFDLKRTERLTLINQVIKPNWKAGSVLLPIPQYEVLNNPNLQQNPGY